MKYLIENIYNISDSDVTEVVKRVKVLMINSSNEILLAYLNNTYQFPGGHVEDGESLIEGVYREIEEETGIVLNNYDNLPFAVSYRYFKDYPEIGKNRKNEIYYYVIKTDEKYNIDNTFYTEKEINGNFELRYILLNDIEKILKDNALEYGDRKGIANEMMEVIKIYKSMKDINS